MEDSPLSITASITGILTFVAAILASVYIRYQTLKNGYMELATVLQSLSSSSEERRMVAKETGSSNDPAHATSQVRQIMEELFQVEIAIFKSYLSVRQIELPAEITWEQAIEQYYNGIRRHEAFIHRHLSDLQKPPRWNLWVELRPKSNITSIESTLMAILRLGTTRTLMRWYMVREEVLENMQTRDYLRSRLLIAQISALSS